MALVLLVLYSIPLLYGTLQPFRFIWHPGRDRIIGRSRVEWVPFARPCPIHGFFCPENMGLNIAIFIPVGVLLALLPVAGARAARRLMCAGAIGFALSLSIETTQYFIPARFPGATDIVWNTFGALLGGGLVVALIRTPPPAPPQQP